MDAVMYITFLYALFKFEVLLKESKLEIQSEIVL